MSPRSIHPVSHLLDAELQLPGSKSQCNRALLAAALASGSTVISNFLFCEDTLQLLGGLEQLGISMSVDRTNSRVQMSGCGGYLPQTSADIDCAASGTMLRFLMGLCSTSAGQYRLHGDGRLHQRPVGPLADALRRLGALIEFESEEGFAPVVMRGQGLVGGQVAVDASLSSQFASAILLSGPCARRDLLLEITGRPVSIPYVRMTLDIQEHFGIQWLTEDYRRIVVPAPQQYVARHIALEPDASTAGYFLAAAALCGGQMRIIGLGRRSRQADLAIGAVLRDMGCRVNIDDNSTHVQRERGAELHGVDVDLSAAPDLVPTVAVLALACSGPTTIRNIGHIRYKESDRLACVAQELQRLGARANIQLDDLFIDPPGQITPATLHMHNDHRLAMAFSLVGLIAEGVTIDQPDCVAKSFPNYFSVLAKLTS